jgi:thiol-disulfide isomerase/thioredoxin
MHSPNTFPLTGLCLTATLLCAATGCSDNAAPAPAAANTAPSGGNTPPADSAGDRTPTPPAAAEPTVPEPQAITEVTLDLLPWDDVHAILKSHQGKIVVLDCWATYCDPCRREFPGLVKLSRELPPGDVVYISLSLDETGDEAKALAFLQEQDSLMKNILCTTDTDQLYDEILKIGSIPAVFVYGRDGEIAQLFAGGTPDGGEFTYEEHIAPYVRELAAQK